MVRLGSLLIAILFASGCAMAPYDEDTTSNFKKPSEGMAGIYVYQWKTGIFNALLDVGFEIKDEREITLNTGEYGYFELEPGEYEYELYGGILPQYLPVKFKANENYFFRAALSSLTDSAHLVEDQHEIEAAKRNILTGRYEVHDKD